MTIRDFEIDKDIRRASTLPARVYSDPEYFEAQKDRVFARSRTVEAKELPVDAAFGLAWVPCLTPTFGTGYSMALTQGTAGRGAFLTVFYCLGLGIPFVLVALGFGWVTSMLGFVRRHRAEGIEPHVQLQSPRMRLRDRQRQRVIADVAA